MDLTTPARPRRRSSVDVPPTPEAAGGPVRTPRPNRDRQREPSSTPVRTRVLAITAAALVVALAALLTAEVSRERSGLQVIGAETAPVVMASSDLYFALGDMDAQLANVLLVGNDKNLGFTRDDALTIYQQRRGQVSVALQQAAKTAAVDNEATQAVRDILDALGRYETLAAQMILLDEQDAHPAGQPAATTLAKYREATDLLKKTLLTAAQGLIDRNSQILEDTYQQQRDITFTIRIVLAILGAALLAALMLLQLYVARRFHRWLNPAVALATLIAAALAISGWTLTTNGAEYLRVAKKDSFDSVLALNRARAVSYDANADESRYLVDPQRAAAYEKTFLDKTQQLVTLDGATLSTFDERLAAAFDAYRADPAAIEWQGYYGKGFRNVTFVGERELAERTLAAYQTYQLDDRKIRKLASSGKLRAAIAFCTSYNKGDSNYHFNEYDKVLASWTDLNESWFKRSIDDGKGQLQGWTVLPAAGALLGLVLLALGLRRRVAEYR
jgi:hypothetical protein